MLEWIKEHGTLLAVLSIALFVVSVAIGLWIAMRLPANYLVQEELKRPVVGFTGIARSVGKNLLGVVLLAIGLVMSLPMVPGPGVLMMIVGFSVMSFSGKRKLEHKLVGNRYVLKSLNRLRAMAGRAAIERPVRSR